jgi:hypothetical protein
MHRSPIMKLAIQLAQRCATMKKTWPEISQLKRSAGLRTFVESATIELERRELEDDPFGVLAYCELADACAKLDEIPRAYAVLEHAMKLFKQPRQICEIHLCLGEILAINAHSDPEAKFMAIAAMEAALPHSRIPDYIQERINELKEIPGGGRKLPDSAEAHITRLLSAGLFKGMTIPQVFKLAQSTLYEDELDEDIFLNRLIAMDKSRFVYFDWRQPPRQIIERANEIMHQHDQRDLRFVDVQINHELRLISFEIAGRQFKEVIQTEIDTVGMINRALAAIDCQHQFYELPYFGDGDVYYFLYLDSESDSATKLPCKKRPFEHI